MNVTNWPSQVVGVINLYSLDMSNFSTGSHFFLKKSRSIENPVCSQ